MAWAVLKGLGAPSLVSRLEIDGAAPKVIVTEGCRVDNLKAANGIVSFDRLDDALPMPIDERAVPADGKTKGALELAPILDDLSRYELRISGLAGAAYEVTIDGEAAGKVSGEALAKGWNLAAAAGPITKQSRQVLALVFQKNNLYFNRWREVQLYSFPGWARGEDVEGKRTTELARLDRQIAESEAQIDLARKPKSHHFEVKPAAQ
jgi:hypothetical protein